MVIRLEAVKRAVRNTIVNRTREYLQCATREMTRGERAVDDRNAANPALDFGVKKQKEEI